MDGIWRILTLSAILGLSSFGIGVLPLSFTFSNKRRHQLSTFGNGLLLGAALGVIIPEGIEALPSTPGSSPTSTTALSLLFGFTLMLIIEQYLAPHAPPTVSLPNSRESYQILSPIDEHTEYDMQPIDIEGLALPPTPRTDNSRQSTAALTPPVITYPLTLGLVIHSLADGLALGASAAGEDSSDMSLSLVVFFALIIHKSPTALALTTSLLSTTLPRSEIKKHVAFFSVATPLGALSSFGILSLIGARAGSWTGIALLVSGGTFLYVATVIQAIGGHSHDHGDSSPVEELTKLQRVSLLVGGIFLPFVIGSVFGHGHDQGHSH